MGLDHKSQSLSGPELSLIIKIPNIAGAIATYIAHPLVMPLTIEKKLLIHESSVACKHYSLEYPI